MRPFPSRSTVFLSTVVLASFAIACQRDLPTEASIDAGSAYARHTAEPAPASVNLGVLPGDNSSRANAVNNAGEVVGYSCGVDCRAFVTIGNVLTALSGTGANALAISNGSVRYVAGWAGAPSMPVRWSITGNTPGQPFNLSLGTATWGAALGVNDAGAAVGHAGVDAAMWDTDGNITLVPTPSGFTRGEGRDINNSGDAVFVFTRSDAGWPNGISIGYLRLSSGEMIPLPPSVSSGISYANSVSSPANNLLQIAGSSYADPSSSRAVVWTVDIATQQIVSTETRSETSHAVAISDNGAAAGFTEGPTNSLKSKAFRWQGAEFLTLSPPKSAKDAIAWGISSNGVFVAGEAIVQLSRRAVLWTMPSQ